MQPNGAYAELLSRCGPNAAEWQRRYLLVTYSTRCCPFLYWVPSLQSPNCVSPLRWRYAFTRSSLRHGRKKTYTPFSHPPDVFSFRLDRLRFGTHFYAVHLIQLRHAVLELPIVVIAVGFTTTGCCTVYRCVVPCYYNSTYRAVRDTAARFSLLVRPGTVCPAKRQGSSDWGLRKKVCHKRNCRTIFLKLLTVERNWPITWAKHGDFTYNHYIYAYALH